MLYLVRAAMLLSLSLTLGAKDLFASTIQSSSEHSDQISVIMGQDGGSGNDMITVRPANASGISYNKFTTFSVTDKPLKIVNAPGKDADGVATSPSTLVVLEAPDFILNQPIELVGPAADLLIIATNASGDISCVSCELNNVNRAVLAAATPLTPFSNDMASVGQMSTNLNGSVTVSSLTAPSALSVELVSRNIIAQGEISTHQKVSPDGLGGFTKNINGSYVMGSGGINIVHGSMDWNYETQSVLKAYPLGTTASIGGTFKAVALNVTSSEGLLINSSVDTRTDLLTTVRYAGKTHVSKELISYASLGGDIHMSGSFMTDGVVTLSSAQNLIVEQAANLSAPTVNLFAQLDIENHADLEMDKLGVAGRSVLNRARVESFDSIEMWSEYDLNNNFGGTLIAPTIHLESENGVVRNGSRVPYIPDATDSDHDNWPLATGYISKDMDLLELGTFYREEIQVSLYSSQRQDQNISSASFNNKPVNSHAHILADQLKIKARYVENINPYWENVSENGSASLNKALVNQVTMSADEGIWIDTNSYYNGVMVPTAKGNYVLNSSAVMRVNDVGGVLSVKTGQFTNERYRNLTLLHKVDSQIDISETYESTGFVTKAYIYSPPGLLVSMGNMQMDAVYSFINNVAYLEVFGDAEIKANGIHDIGLEHNGIQNVLTSKAWISLGNNTFILSEATSEQEEISILDAKEMDSLFFIHGNVKGDQSKFFSKNYTPFEAYKDMAVANTFKTGFDGEKVDGLVNSDFYECDYGGTTVNCYDTTVTETSYEIVDNKIYSTVDETEIVHYLPPAPSVSHHTNTVETKEFSLFDELVKIWESLLELISEVLAEITWWSEE